MFWLRHVLILLLKLTGLTLHEILGLVSLFRYRASIDSKTMDKFFSETVLPFGNSAWTRESIAHAVLFILSLLKYPGWEYLKSRFRFLDQTINDRMAGIAQSTMISLIWWSDFTCLNWIGTWCFRKRVSALDPADRIAWFFHRIMVSL